MGKLIKANLARLIVLTAATCHPPAFVLLRIKLTPSLDHVAASLEGIFWPKIFWDFLTKKLDRAVKPFPYLPIMNLALSFSVLAYEWPLIFLANSILSRSIRAKLFALPFPIMAAALMYQGIDPALYYMIGTLVYALAIRSGETVLVEQSRHSFKRQNIHWPGHFLRKTTPKFPLQHQPPAQIRRAISIELDQYLPLHHHNDLLPYFDPTFRMVWGSDLAHNLIPGPRASNTRVITQGLDDAIKGDTRM